MRFAHLLIVTYGRTGSTLLQGILNSIDGCLVRGENFDVCDGLFRSFRSLGRARAEYGAPVHSGDPSRPWFGANEFDDEKFFRDARALIDHQLNPVGPEIPCVGFKEIRYLSLERRPGHPATDERLRDYLWFLVKLFGNPAIIFLTRAHKEVSRSGWWATFNPAVVEKRLNAFENSCAHFSDNYGQAFHIGYEDLVGRTQRLRDLFAFLGATYDDEQVESVLNRQHSTRSRALPAAAESDHQTT